MTTKTIEERGGREGRLNEQRENKKVWNKCFVDWFKIENNFPT